MSQTTYATHPNPGAVGEPAFAGANLMKLETYSNVNNVLDFGRAVMKVAGADRQADLFDNSAACVGITLLEKEQITGNYPVKASCAVCSFGAVWVNPELDVSSDDAVFVRIAGRKQVQTITASADFVAGNTITGKVNGNNISVAFNANNATTLAALTTAIALIGGVNSTADNGVHIETVTSDQDVTLVLTNFLVTGGASQATLTVAQTVAGIPNSAKGSFRNDADGGTAIQLKNARYLYSTTAYPTSTLKLTVVDLVMPFNN